MLISEKEGATTYYINPKSLVTMPEICQMIKVSRRTLYTMIKNGTFPKPFKQLKQRNFWVYQSVIDYIEGLNESN